MREFFSGIFQNIIADVLFILLALVGGWFLSLQFRWRVLYALLRLQRSGVSNLYLDRSEYISRRSVSVLDFIQQAQRSFEYAGVYFSLATDQSRIDDVLRSIIQKGCQVRVALLNQDAPDSTFAYLEKHFALAQQSLRPRVIHAREHFVALRNSLAPHERERLEIRIHNLPITDSAFIIDREGNPCHVLVDRKWYGSGRERSFGIEFNGQVEAGSLMETVTHSFRRIIDEADSA